MMKKIRFLIGALLFAGAVACGEEDPVHMPEIPADITAMELEGQIELTIDKDLNRVDAVMEESADLSCVRVLKLEMNEDTYLLEERDYLDLTTPDTLLLMSTQQEKWVVSAVQPVSRYIKVEGQVGDAEIDVVNRKAIVYLSKAQDLSAVTFLDIKLEALGSVVVSTAALTERYHQSEQQ